MFRCLELAKQGAGYTAPNPMVGAVLVYNEKIMGEGYHQRYGEAHAEVNCINQAMQNGKKDLLKHSTLYVSLEPCAHFGKTPPCTDLIIKNGIPKLIIGCRDPNKDVQGKGIEKLSAAGIETKVDILENECKELNKRFFTFHLHHRPYIILKWAQTADGKIAAFIPEITVEDFENNNGNGKNFLQRLKISNEYSNRMVHKWRSEEASILVGTNTALLDDPELNTRFWKAPSPIRLVVDMNLRLPSSLKIFNRQNPTIVFNTIKHEEENNLLYWQVTNDVNLVHQVINALYHLKIQSVLVEGGARLLQSFIDEGLWDEARIISNPHLAIGNGIASPLLENADKIEEQKISSDIIAFYKPTTTDS
jgi:diaminohydroxyphosphoribosylaminopyrimidine deaminase/5-amino-6-(5-phosphoribosylamino)uracil reductase